MFKFGLEYIFITTIVELPGFAWEQFHLIGEILVCEIYYQIWRIARLDCSILKNICFLIFRNFSVYNSNPVQIRFSLFYIGILLQ